MNDVKIIKSLEDWGLVINGVTETVKCEIKKQGISTTSDLIVRRAGRGCMDKNF